MSEFGTIILDRGIFNHPCFDSVEFTEREAWIWLIVAAVKSPRDLRRNHIITHLERGQCAHSYRFLAKRWKWTVARVQRFLSRLVTESMITTAVTESHPSQQVTVITICNYDKYQGRPEPPACGNDTPPIQISETLTLDSRDSVVDGGVARARESFRITEQAFGLADEVMQILGIDLKFIPPPWMGFAMWVQAGLNGGWRPEFVRIAAARIRARKNYHIPFSFKYLDRPILREHELAAETPLPIPPVIVSKTQDQSHAGKTADSSTWQGRRDNFRRAQAELSQALDESSTEARSEGSAEVVRFTTANGRR